MAGGGAAEELDFLWARAISLRLVQLNGKNVSEVDLAPERSTEMITEARKEQIKAAAQATCGRLNSEEFEIYLRTLLTEVIPWCPSPDDCFEIPHDDTDGDQSQILSAGVLFTGDFWIHTCHPRRATPLRFRPEAGGGHRHAVRNALALLCLAIQIDADPLRGDEE